MCLTLLITTGCDTNREEDVNEGGINDNIICFSELFKDDVIVYTGFHKGDAPIGKDSEISLMKIFTPDGKEGMETTYWLGSDRYRGRELGKFAKMQVQSVRLYPPSAVLRENRGQGKGKAADAGL